MLVGLLIVAALAAACGGSADGECVPVEFTSDASAELPAARDALTFEPVLPCALRTDFEVTSVLASTAAALPPEARISFVVDRRAERAFVLSETRAELPFTAIPRNTHQFRARSGDLVAAGFAGPSTSGEEIAYLRWRAGGVTYELAATLATWLREEDVQAIAAALMAASADKGGSEATNDAEE